VYDTEDEGQESPRVMVSMIEGGFGLVAFELMLLHKRKLWLFQPDMIISYGSSDEPATISQVAKILYTFPEPSSSG
jgi:hypothetical protein